MTSQLLTEQASPTTGAWSRLFHAYAAITRDLNAELSAEHGMTINEFEVLVLLARAPERSLRRIDLANQVLLSPSGITRMLNRLGKTGLVCNRSCPTDQRVTWAVLTDAGAERLEAALATQREAVARLIGTELSDAELEQLAELLGRLPGADQDCGA